MKNKSQTTPEVPVESGDLLYKNNTMIKLLTCSDEWEYFGNYETQIEAFNAIRKHNLCAKRTMFEFDDGTYITLENLQQGKKPQKPIMGILPV